MLVDWGNEFEWDHLRFGIILNNFVFGVDINGYEKMYF